jgi:hypothetical protein
MDGDGGANRVRDWSEMMDHIREVIYSLAGPICMSRMSYAIPDLHISLTRLVSQIPQCFPFDLPCSLHTNPCTWPNDKSGDGNKVMEATLMLLDHPSEPARIILPESDCRWVGYKREWIAVVCRDNPVQWYLVNLYSCTRIPIPSIQIAKFEKPPYYGPFTFTHDFAITKLRKIHIAEAPEFINCRWIYKLIVVFSRFIVILATDPCFTGMSNKWIVLTNTSLAPREYVDVAWTYERIFVVTAFTGDVFVWEPRSYG